MLKHNYFVFFIILFFQPNLSKAMDYSNDITWVGSTLDNLGNIKDLKFNPCGTRFAVVGTKPSFIHVYDVETKTVIWKKEEIISYSDIINTANLADFYNSAVFHPSLDIIALITKIGIMLYNYTNDKYIDQDFELPEKKDIASFVFSPDGQFIALGNSNLLQVIKLLNNADDSISYNHNDVICLKFTNIYYKDSYEAVSHIKSVSFDHAGQLAVIATEKSFWLYGIHKIPENRFDWDLKCYARFDLPIKFIKFSKDNSDIFISTENKNYIVDFTEKLYVLDEYSNPVLSKSAIAFCKEHNELKSDGSILTEAITFLSNPYVKIPKLTPENDYCPQAKSSLTVNQNVIIETYFDGHQNNFICIIKENCRIKNIYSNEIGNLICIVLEDGTHRIWYKQNEEWKLAKDLGHNITVVFSPINQSFITYTDCGQITIWEPQIITKMTDK